MKTWNHYTQPHDAIKSVPESEPEEGVLKTMTSQRRAYQNRPNAHAKFPDKVLCALEEKTHYNHLCVANGFNPEPCVPTGPGV